MVLCLNLYTAMRDLLCVIDELTAADATEGNTHKDVLAAVTVVATTMSQKSVHCRCPSLQCSRAQFKLLFY
jgi:hypothetical protein